jgi:hypothetical protein
MEKLPSFLPVLFDAFGNQNAEVRKVQNGSLFTHDYGHCSLLEVCKVCFMCVTSL